MGKIMKLKNNLRLLGKEVKKVAPASQATKAVFGNDPFVMDTTGYRKFNKKRK